MNSTRRMVTTSRPVITQSTWLEVKAKFLHDIVSAVIEHKVPDELTINVDQTPSKYVPAENVTMAEKNSKHIPRKGGNDKRAITVTLAETLSGTILPFQLIYQGKTRRSLPAVKLPAGFSLRVTVCNHQAKFKTRGKPLTIDFAYTFKLARVMYPKNYLIVSLIK